MRRAGDKPSLHELVNAAVARGAHLQNESRAAVEELRATTAALLETVATIKRGRAERARAASPPKPGAVKFGNGHVDVQRGARPG